MIATSDPQIDGRRACSEPPDPTCWWWAASSGLAFLAVGDPSEWKLPFALAVTVFVSSYVIHIRPCGARAPITAAGHRPSGLKPVHSS